MTNDLLYFPIQIAPIDKEKSDCQQVSNVRMRLTDKLNKVAKGGYQLTMRDKRAILTANRIFSRNGYPTIDVDLSQL